MKLLLVDDEIEFASSLAERLILRGIDTDWSSSSQDALKKVEKKCYNVVVTDIKMPLMDGIALKKKLQKKCPDMKFIFLTGHGSSEEFEAGVSETGADFYLLKPLQIEVLIEKINKVLNI
ncbi:MAG: response regulator [Deltaproteobacteria bacterium]|jgi:DNA-binding response OmpR family regulator|nr:response regulator [Deltaproteobacteria bacterium]